MISFKLLVGFTSNEVVFRRSNHLDSPKGVHRNRNDEAQLIALMCSDQWEHNVLNMIIQRTVIWVMLENNLTVKSHKPGIPKKYVAKSLAKLAIYARKYNTVHLWVSLFWRVLSQMGKIYATSMHGNVIKAGIYCLFKSSLGNRLNSL